MRLGEAAARATTGGAGDRLAADHKGPIKNSPLSFMSTPSVTDDRRRAERRDRWHTALAMARVAALASLAFWLLPLPAASRTSPVPPTPTEKEHRP